MKKFSEEITLLVAAAGNGSRMGFAELPKALIAFREKPLIEWALASFRTYLDKLVVVIRPEHQSIFQTHFLNDLDFKNSLVFQNEPRGTAFAIEIGLSEIQTEWVLVVWGDHVGASQLNASKFLKNAERSDADFVLPLVYRKTPYVYFSPNLLTDALSFHETRLGAPTIPMGLSDCGIFLFRKEIIETFLQENLLKDEPKTGKERNFLSLFSEMQTQGIRFHIVHYDNEVLSFGVNSPSDLRELEQVFIKEVEDGE